MQQNAPVLNSRLNLTVAEYQKFPPRTKVGYESMVGHKLEPWKQMRLRPDQFSRVVGRKQRIRGQSLALTYSYN